MKPISAVILPLSLLALAGCVSNPLEVRRTSCPAVAVAKHSGTLTRFAEPGRFDVQDVQFSAAIANVSPSCVEDANGARTAVTLDIQAANAIDRLTAMCGGKVDLVLSDMAPAMSGHREVDQLRSVALAEIALDIAGALLKRGGNFVAKLRQGAGEVEFVAALKSRFAAIKRAKPPSSRGESAEFFILATGFKG